MAVESTNHRALPGLITGVGRAVAIANLRAAIYDASMADVFLTAADLSSDATLVAFTTLTAGGGEDRERLWITTLGVGETDPIEVELPGPASSLAWAPHQNVLAAGVPIDGVRQIVLIDVDGSWRPITDAVRGIAGSFCWSPDGSELVAAVLHDEPSTIDRAVAVVDGMGSVAEQVSDIHVIEVGTGASTPLTDGPTVDRWPVFDSSGSRILFARSFEPDNTLTSERPLLVDRDGAIHEMTWTASANATMAPLPDGRMVLVATRQSDRTRGVPASLCVGSSDGTLTDRSVGLDLHLLLSTLGDQPSGIEDPRRFVGVHGDDAIVGVCRQGTAQVVRLSLSGPVGATTVLDGERGCHPLALKGDRLLFVESTMQRPPTLRLVDLTTGAESMVVDPNPRPPSPAFDVHELDVVSQGDPIQAWFLRPADRPTAPLATVLIIHGGPYEAFGHTYYGDAHLLVEAGYGVVMANPHGSIGYGAAFATSIFGRPSHPEVDDLLAVLDQAIELGLADPARLAVCGLSYGGYMSAHLVGRTDRFRAAVIENPLIDMVSFRATSDIGADLLDEMVQGRPDDVPDRYRDCSPLHYAEHCRTPSLLILGEDDHRCPPSQGLQFRDALRRSGCVTDVVWLSGAAHADSALGTAHVRMEQDGALLDWMQRHNPV